MVKSRHKLIRRERLSEQLSASILERWRTGELQPGQRLDELSLAEAYGVSRTPVREALFQLAQDGIVVETNRGMMLRQSTPQDVDNLLEVRLLLEPAIMRHAAEDATQKQISRLAKTLKLETEAVKQNKTKDFITNSYRFRQQLRSMSGNELLAKSVALLDDRFTASRITASKSRTSCELVVNYHTELLKAIENRDPDAAAQLTRSFLNKIREVERQSGS